MPISRVRSVTQYERTAYRPPEASSTATVPFDLGIFRAQGRVEVIEFTEFGQALFTRGVAVFGEPLLQSELHGFLLNGFVESCDRIVRSQGSCRKDNRLARRCQKPRCGIRGTRPAVTRIPARTAAQRSTRSCHVPAAPRSWRRLAPEARIERGDYDGAIVIADGLSATAVHRHAAALLRALTLLLADWRLAPLAVVRQGRVAIGDEIGQQVGARLVVVLIGQRGADFARQSGCISHVGPRPGRTDAQRNCFRTFVRKGWRTMPPRIDCTC
jgi:Ethanolamine ammonia-lyase light chain (EutC)